MLPEIGLAKGACTLWQEDLLLDYTIEVEDEQFKVHKVIMASVSDYFKAMLTGGMLESREDKVKLEGLSSLAVHNIIEFVYTGQFGSSKASAEERLACAVYLQIPAAAKICAALLCEEVNMVNCFRILSLFKSYGIKDGIEHTVKFMKHHLEEILVDCKPEDLTYEEFLGLMDCWGRSEWELFVMAMQWLKKDHENRKEHLNEIMSHMRFCLMLPTELALIASITGIGILCDGPWQDLVEKAFKYHDLPTHQKVLEESEQAKVRTEPSPVCFGVHPSLSGQVFAIHQGKSWTHYDTVNPPVFRDVTGIDINQFLVVCVNSGAHDVHCYIFDPRTLTWSALAPMGVPRDKCALVYHDKYLYALGGRDRHVEDTNEPTDVIEKYDFRTNTWSASKMPVTLFKFDALSIGGCIYIPGGWITKDEFSQTLYCFDTEAGRWSAKAQCIPGRGSNMVCVEIDREKVICNIDEDLKLHYYKPSVEQWLAYDGCVHSKLKFDDRCSLFAAGNTMYLVNFVHDKDKEEESHGGAGDENQLPRVSEKWTFCENRLRIDSKIPILTNHKSSGLTSEYFTEICALLSIVPPSVSRGSAAS